MRIPRKPQRLLCSFALSVILFGTQFIELAQAQATSWESIASLNYARSGSAAALLDGSIFVAGGESANGDILDLVEKYDLTSSSWEVLSERTRRPRKNATLAQWNGRLILIGGRDHEGNVLNSVEEFDPAAGDWNSFPQLQERREGAQAVVLAGELYVLGGSDEDGSVLQSVEAYDADTDSWSIVDGWSLQKARASFSATVLADAVYLIGGFDTFGPVTPVERYNEADGNSVVGSFVMARGNLAAAAIGDSVLVAGGRNSSSQVVASVSYFELDGSTWEPGPSLIRARERFVLVAAGSRMYAIGGRDAFGNTIAEVELLDLTTGVGVNDVRADEAGFGLTSLYPNPAQRAVTVVFEASPEQLEKSTLEVFDVLGRRIARLETPRGLARDVTWDLTDDAGADVVAGVYLVSMTHGAMRSTRQVVVVR